MRLRTFIYTLAGSVTCDQPVTLTRYRIANKISNARPAKEVKPQDIGRERRVVEFWFTKFTAAMVCRHVQLGAPPRPPRHVYFDMITVFCVFANPRERAHQGHSAAPS